MKPFSTAITTALIGISFAAVGGARAAEPIEVGRPFPDLVLPTLEGQPASLADYRGRKVLLHVFASW